MTWLLAELALLGGFVFLALYLRVANVEHYSGSFDEGIRMQQLLLMELGYRPFRDIFASQGPLLLDLLFPFYLLYGKTLGAARLGVSALSLAGLVGAWWSLRPLHPLAGLGAAGLLALSPGYLENSRLALAEIPSLAPCVWAIGCAVRWQRGGRDVWLAAAALLATLGVLVKPMALPIAAPLAVLAVTRHPVRVPAVAMSLGLAGAFGVAVLLALDPGRVLEVLGAYRGGAQGALGSDARENLGLVMRTLGSERPGFLVLGGVGAVLGLIAWRWSALGLLAWPLAESGLFLLYTDLADKHVVYAIPPLALLGGLAVGGVGAALRQLVPRRTALVLGTIAVGVVALGFYAWTVPALWRADRELLRDGDERARRDYDGTIEQANLMESLAGAGEFVLTDNPIAAFYARRPVPPWLVDTSGTRVEAGSLTSEIAIREAERYRPAVVVTLQRRLGKLDGFVRWLGRDYRLVKTYPGSDPSTPLRLYVRADLEPRAQELLAAR